MITLNKKQVFPYASIILTSTAFAEESYVFMQEGDQPEALKLAWLEIYNVAFDPSIDEDPKTNPKFIIQMWVMIRDIMSMSFPVDTGEVDEFGDKIFKPTPTNTSIVKVVFSEHKEVLRDYKAKDNLNLADRLALHGKDLSLQHFLPLSRKQMTWENIADFMLVDKLRLDEGEEYLDENNNPLLTEYPPVIPVNMMWRNISLGECLNNLLVNFDSRVVAKTIAFPFQEATGEWNFEPADDVYTYLQWKRHRRIEYRDDIHYESIQWPIDQTQQRILEDNAFIFFRNLGSATCSTAFAVPNSYTNIASEISYTEQQIRSNVDLVCELYPYGLPHYASDFESISTYLKENNVDVDTYYGFTTKSLPPDFIESAEWTRIEFKVNESDMGFLVEKKPRLRNSLTNPYFNNEVHILTGVVEQAGTTSLVSNILNTNTGEMYLGKMWLPLFTPGTAVGKYFTCMLSGESILPISIGSGIWDDAPEYIDVKFDGNVVDKIIHEIMSFDFSCSDTSIILVDEAVSLPIKYTFAGVVQDNSFSKVEFECVEAGSIAGGNVTIPGGQGSATIRFRLTSNRQDLIDYLVDSSPTYPVEYHTARVDWFMANGETIEIQLFNGQLPRTFEVFHAGTGRVTQNPTANTVPPDLNTSDFTGPNFSLPGGLSFPINFNIPTGSYGGTIIPQYIPSGSVGELMVNMGYTAQQLALRYIANHVYSHTFQIRLEYP